MMPDPTSGWGPPNRQQPPGWGSPPPSPPWRRSGVVGIGLALLASFALAACQDATPTAARDSGLTSTTISVTQPPLTEPPTTEAPTSGPPTTAVPTTHRAPPATHQPPTTRPAPRTTGAPSGNCDPSYPGSCLHDGIGDYDCAGGSGNGPNYVSGPIRVRPPDPFGLDRDGDGVGCEH
jgi:hypothetical protein